MATEPASLEVAIIDWLLTRTTLMALLNDDPKRLDQDWKGSMEASHITGYRAGGGQDPYSHAETALITFHCYGTSRWVADKLAGQLAAELRALGEEPLNELVSGRGARVESISFLPTGAGKPRYIVIASVTAMIAAPAA